MASAVESCNSAKGSSVSERKSRPPGDDSRVPSQRNKWQTIMDSSKKCVPTSSSIQAQTSTPRSNIALSTSFRTNARQRYFLQKYSQSYGRSLRTGQSANHSDIVDKNIETPNSYVCDTDNIIESMAVGVFGGHEYNINPIWRKRGATSEAFTRTYEGSIFVYLATWIAVGFLFGKIPHYHFWMSALIVPPSVTLLEIKVPHKMEETNIAIFILSCRFLAGKIMA